jgi:hypothetical protein
VAELAEAELKYNWAKIAHFLLEAFAAHDFKAGEFRVLMIVCRETYGRSISKDDARKKQFCTLSQAVISELVGMPEPSIRRLIAGLVKRCVLLRLPPKNPTAPWQLGINTKIQEWDVKLDGRIRESKYPRRWEGEEQRLEGGSQGDGGDHTGSPIPSMGDPGVTGGITQDRMGDPGVTGGSAAIPITTTVCARPKEPCIKEPLSERESRFADPDPALVVSLEKQAKDLAVDMFRNFSVNWWPQTGAPSALLSDCRDYAMDWRSHLDAAWQAFDTVLTDTLNWQDANGKVVGRPGDKVLNRAGKMLRDLGLEPLPRGQPLPPIYSDDDSHRRTA